MSHPNDFSAKINKAIENFTQRLSQAVDYFTKNLSILLESLIKFLQTILRKIYLFAKTIFVSFVKILWALIKIFLFFLAPAFAVFYGLEIISTTTGYLLIVGWALMIIGASTLLIFTFLLLASFSEIAKPDETQPSEKKRANKEWVFILIDFIATGILIGVILWNPNYYFHWWPVKGIEDNIRFLVYQDECFHKPGIAKIIRVTNNANESVDFVLTQSQFIRIFAIGEIAGDSRVDYGWIEDVNTNQVVWEMRMPQTVNAGGANKNRQIDIVREFAPGKYTLHYKSDDSHSFGNWTAPPPNINFWGIALYSVE